MQNRRPPQSVAVKALVIDNDKKILLGRRIGNTDNGLFEFPGGTVEEDEDLDEALKREVMEEAGVLVEPVGLGKDKGNPLQVVQSSTKRAVLLFFSAKVVSKDGQVKETDEMYEVDFYTKEQAQKFLDDGEVRKVNDELVKRFLEGEFDEG